MRAPLRTAKMVLIDLNGTLLVENNVLPGIPEAMDKLRSSNLVMKFVTNTSWKCKRKLYEQRTVRGFDIMMDEIHTCLSAVRQVIEQRHLKPMLLLSESALEDFHGVEEHDDDQQNAVIVGLAPTEFHYTRLNKAFRLLLGGASLIGADAATYYRQADGWSLGPGFFIKGLESAANMKAEIVGKPSAAFFMSALVNTPPEDAIMIGDDIQADIQGARSIGMRAILVQTGKYKQGSEETVPEPLKPTAVVPTFAEAVEVVLKDYTDFYDNI